MLITAWWDVNRQFAPGYNPRRRRVRPLRELERFLGHRVSISGFDRYECLPPNQYQYTAQSWLDAASIDDAVMFTLKQLSRLDLPIYFALTRLNRAAFDDPEWEGSVIGSFYWDTELRPPLETIGSAGVLLHVTRMPRKKRRPGEVTPHRIISVPPSKGDRATYIITLEIGLLRKPEDVRALHWPRYRDTYGLHEFELIQTKGRPASGQPSHLVLTRTLENATEAEAICTALASATQFSLRDRLRCRLQIHRHANFSENRGCAWTIRHTRRLDTGSGVASRVGSPRSINTYPRAPSRGGALTRRLERTEQDAEVRVSGNPTGHLKVRLGRRGAKRLGESHEMSRLGRNSCAGAAKEPLKPTKKPRPSLPRLPPISTVAVSPRPLRLVSTQKRIRHQNKKGVTNWNKESTNILTELLFHNPCHKVSAMDKPELRVIEGGSMDKQKALDAALAQIEKHFGKGSIMRLGANDHSIDVEAIPTGSLGLDIALGIGGLPKGRIIEIYGPESSGKTTMTLHIIAEAQKRGGTCAFIDAEHALDPVYARKLGIKVDELLISQPDTGEQALEIADTLVRSGAIDVLVIDSVAALTPKAELEGEMGDSLPGLQARLMSQALRKLTGSISKSGTMVIFINQIRMKIGIMFGNPETTTGGNALKFYASVRLDIRRIGQIKEREEAVGNQTRVKVVKNKVAPPFREVEFDIMYGEGISKTGEIIDLGVKAGVVEKSGAWISYKGQRIGQGRENAKAFLKANPDVANAIEQAVRQNAGLIGDKLLVAPEAGEAEDADASPEDIDENGEVVGRKGQRAKR
jgi:recombination protein RecA